MPALHRLDHDTAYEQEPVEVRALVADSRREHIPPFGEPWPLSPRAVWTPSLPVNLQPHRFGRRRDLRTCDIEPCAYPRCGIDLGRINAASLGLWQVFPHLVLMEPYRIGVSGDELIWMQALNENWTRHTLLSSIQEDEHEFGLSASLGRLLGGREFSLWLDHSDRAAKVKSMYEITAKKIAHASAGYFILEARTGIEPV
jgi:hypothetical protein